MTGDLDRIADQTTSGSRSPEVPAASHKTHGLHISRPRHDRDSSPDRAGHAATSNVVETVAPVHASEAAFGVPHLARNSVLWRSIGVLASLTLHSAVLAGFIVLQPQDKLQAPSGGVAIEMDLVVGLVESDASQARPAEKIETVSADVASPASVDEPVPTLQSESLPPPSPLPPPVETQQVVRSVAQQPLPSPHVPVELPPVVPPPNFDALLQAQREKALRQQRERQALATAAAERRKQIERQKVEVARQKREQQQREVERRRLAEAAQKRRERARERQQAALEKKREAASSRAEAARQRRAKAKAEADKRVLAAARSARGSNDRNSTASARGGTGGHSQFAGRVSMASHRASILAHLARHKRYPAEARSRSVTGRTTVAFRVDPNGSVSSISLAGTSGSALLDRATLDMVRRAAPFPRGPSTQVFRVGIRYDLR